MTAPPLPADTARVGEPLWPLRYEQSRTISGTRYVSGAHGGEEEMDADTPAYVYNAQGKCIAICDRDCHQNEDAAALVEAFNTLRTEREGRLAAERDAAQARKLLDRALGYCWKSSSDNPAEAIAKFLRHPAAHSTGGEP